MVYQFLKYIYLYLQHDYYKKILSLHRRRSIYAHLYSATLIYRDELLTCLITKLHDNEKDSNDNGSRFDDYCMR